MGLHLASTALAGALAGALQSPPTCPPLTAYEGQWLLIVSASKLEADARKLADSANLCVIPSSAFAYLTPGHFLVVAGAKPNRKSANVGLKRVRLKHKAAYAKAAGRLCPSGVPIDPGDTRRLEELDARLAAHKGFNATRSAWPWSFEAQMQGPTPVWAWGSFQQDRIVYDEEYLFDSRGELEAVNIKHFTDTSDGRDEVGPRIKRRYYLIGRKCIFTSAKGDEALACPQPCAKDTSAKLAVRAKLVAQRALEEGKPPDKDWIEEVE